MFTNLILHPMFGRETTSSREVIAAGAAEAAVESVTCSAAVNEAMEAPAMDAVATAPDLDAEKDPAEITANASGQVMPFDVPIPPGYADLSEQQAALVEALVNGTNTAPPRVGGLPAYVKGLGPPPTGAYIEVEPSLVILNRLAPAQLASVIIENKIFGDTEALRALSAKLDQDTVPGMFAAANLAMTTPVPTPPLHPLPKRLKRPRGSRKKIQRTSLFAALDIEVAKPQSPSKPLPAPADCEAIKKDGSANMEGADV